MVTFFFLFAFQWRSGSQETSNCDCHPNISQRCPDETGCKRTMSQSPQTPQQNNKSTVRNDGRIHSVSNFSLLSLCY